MPEVVLSPEPFAPRTLKLEACEGWSVAAILTHCCRQELLDPQDLARTEIYLDGERLTDREQALDLIPQAGQLLNITVLPQGGGGGGNKVLSTVLEVALIAATAWVAGPGGTALAEGIGLPFAVSAVRVAAIAALTISGSTLLQQLNKPQAAATTYDLESQSNQARRGQPMPLCLGKRRYAFDLASSAYSTFSASDTYITAIYALHYGPCTLTDIKIGETLITAYSNTGDIQTEMFLEPGPRNSTLYPTDIHQDSFQNQLDRDHSVETIGQTAYGDQTVETTPIDAATIELDFYWPSGLYFPKADGSIVAATTTIYVEISPYSTNQWAPANGSGGLNSGVLTVKANSKTAIRFTTGINLPSEGQWDVRVSRNYRPSTDVDNDAVVWSAMRTIRTGQPVLDQNLSLLIIKAKASQDFSGSLGVVSGVVEPRVPVWNGTDAWQGDPTTYDAVNWQPSSNAAALARYLLTGYPAAQPLAATEIDATFGTQHDLIAAQDWNASVLVSGEETQQDVLKKLGSAGRFSAYWTGSRMAMTPEWVKPARRQLFASRNASGFRRTRAFPDPIHAVYVTFTNEDEDWKDDGLYVYADGYTAANTSLVENLQLEFACGADRAHKDGRNFLARRVDQTYTYEWTAGIDSIVATLGDRVGARRTSKLYDQTDARVLYRKIVGGLVAGVRLDVSFTMTDGQSYALDVRTPDAFLEGLALASAAGPQRTVMFATPLAPADAPGKGDLVALGRVLHVTEDVEIIDIAPSSDRTAQIKGRNYIGPALVAAETGTIPPNVTFLTARTPAPVPRILSATATSEGAVVGFDVPPQRTSPVAGFAVRWRYTPPAGATGPWTQLPQLPGSAALARTPALNDAATSGSVAQVTLDVEIRSVLATGETSAAAQALAIPVMRVVVAPTNFTAAGVMRTAGNTSTYPAIVVSADAAVGGSLQDLVLELSAGGAFTSAGQPLAAANPVGDITGVVQGSTYSVRGAWRTADGWQSDWVTVTGITFPSQAGLPSDLPDTTTLGGTTVSQVKTDISTAQTTAEAAASAAASASSTASAAATQDALDSALSRITALESKETD